jgi:hypothetical protein
MAKVLELEITNPGLYPHRAVVLAENAEVQHEDRIVRIDLVQPANTALVRVNE